MAGYAFVMVSIYMSVLTIGVKTGVSAHQGMICMVIDRMSSTEVA